jgi:hypothetical protein
MANIEFRFYTAMGLVELTGQRARNVGELLDIVRTVDDSSIFYHTHRYLREYHFVRGEYSSDFGQWAFDSLQEMTLGEKLVGIDIMGYTDIASLRGSIVAALEEYLQSGARLWDVPSGNEFHFCKLISVIFPTSYVATNEDEFCRALKKININSLYYHLFEARLRLGRKTNDFSLWFEKFIGNPSVARQIESLDPYAHTLDELRDEIIRIIKGSTLT